jgi:RHS repeat-associated protein
MLEYDGNNRVARSAWRDPSSDEPTSQTEYAYDALGRRVRKRSAHGASVFYWDQSRLLAEKREDSSEFTEYWFTQNRLTAPICRTNGTRREYYLNDHLGSPQEIINDRGEVVWSATLAPYGRMEATPNANRVANPVRLPGQYHDEETGLFYNLYRYYSPHLGRYLTQDPIDLVGGVNQYGYTPNPIGWADPLGLTPFALGLSSTPSGGLGNFAKSVGATKWDQIGFVRDENGVPDLIATIKKGMDDAESIKFNTEGMTSPTPEQIAANPDPNLYTPGKTDWELATVLSDPELAEKTTLYDGPGKVRENQLGCGGG